MINIAIIEDSDKDFLRLTQHLNKYSSENNLVLQTTHFYDAESFLEKYRPVYDIVFMDIELPKQNGMQAAKKLRSVDPDVALIFITNIASFAVNGYEVDAIDYIVKPVNYSAFCMKFKKVLNYISQNADSTVIIPAKNGVHRVSVSKIIYIEVIAHTLIYHTEDGDIESRGVLKDVENDLLPLHFLRCNNCYLVNLKHISAVHDNDVVLHDIVLPISRPKKKNFLNEFTKYLGV